MANIRKTYKSGAFEAIQASALHKVGAIDQAAMRKFDAAALKMRSDKPQSPQVKPPALAGKK